MPVRKSDSREDKESIADYMPLSRVNYAFYVGILVFAIAICYFVVMEYLVYSDGLPENDLEIEMVRNDVERFSDGLHPVVVVDAAVREGSMVQVVLRSDSYTNRYSSGDYVNNYTAFFILPKDVFSTDFVLSVTARGENGGIFGEDLHFRSADRPKVEFSVE